MCTGSAPCRQPSVCQTLRFLAWRDWASPCGQGAAYSVPGSVFGQFQFTATGGISVPRSPGGACMTLRAEAKGQHPRPAPRGHRGEELPADAWKVEDGGDSFAGPRAAAGGGRRSTQQRPVPPRHSGNERGRPHRRRRRCSRRPCKGTDTVPGRAHEAARAQLGRPVAKLTALGRGSSSQGRAGGGKGSFPGHREGLEAVGPAATFPPCSTASCGAPAGGRR